MTTSPAVAATAVRRTGAARAAVPSRPAPARRLPVRTVIAAACLAVTWFWWAGTPASSGATPGSSEGTTIQKTVGLFLEEAVGIRDRLFLTGAIRTDQNSAFGTNFQRVYYPKASVSWVMSDEDFFPHSAPVLNKVSSLRLRAAYGASGVQPGPNDALRTYAANSASIKGTDAPIETFDQLGNPAPVFCEVDRARPRKTLHCFPVVLIHRCSPDQRADPRHRLVSRDETSRL